MSSNSKSKFWSAGTLKSRGWTEKLMAELLPKCRYTNYYGKRVRTWDKITVLKAEDDPRFKEHKAMRAEQKAGEHREWCADADAAIENAIALLDTCRENAPAQTPGQMLAGQYHRAICRAMGAAAWAERIPEGKCMSYVGNFCAMTAAGKAENIAGTIKRFCTAAVWLGKHPDSGLAGKLRECYCDVLERIGDYLAEDFYSRQPEANLEEFLGMADFPVQELLSHPLSYIYSVIYVPRAIRTSLKMLVALNPKDEYPMARAMERHFIIHIGGTNTGKTYAGFQRLARARSGVYLAPLRLLALEGQETLLDMGVKCSLTTGEEEDCCEDDTHVSATAEKLDMKRYFDVAVIDECQMISDRERGYAWTRAVLGVLAPEIHLCCAPHARDILVRLILSCGDSFEIEEHKRKTPLVCMKRQTDISDLRPGDALITFSKVGVLSLAEDLRQKGKQPAIIYGALPYATRRRQVEGFLSGDMQYVVSTDAIGMGLNLPIRRVIFTETEKFDGVERRSLKSDEVQQIAGRAGRYGMYDKGFVGATENLSQIRQALETVVPPIEHAVVGFSDLVLNVDFDLLEVLQVWNSMPTVEPYMKLDVSRYIALIGKTREKGFELTREQELRAANIPFDETDSELMELYFHFLRQYARGDEVERPGLGGKADAKFTLPELEQHYRKLDLYFSFCKAFGCPVDADDLKDERERVADMINTILLYNLKNNISFCSRCGAALPLHHKGRLCNSCFARRRGGPSFRNWGRK